MKLWYSPKDLIMDTHLSIISFKKMFPLACGLSAAEAGADEFAR